MKMYSYVAYGLGIHCAFPLPELVVVDRNEADVNISLGKIGRSIPERDHRESYFQMTPEEAYLFWKQVGEFLALNGNEIIVDPSPGVAEQLIRLPLLGMVLGAVLQQRRFLALHASAVAVNGDAVAFLGRKGRGKSTIAAALYTRGHNLVADDLVAVDFDRLDSPIVLPGFPQLKLMPEAAATVLGNNLENLPRLATGFEKRGFQDFSAFCPGPLPLRRIYLLCDHHVQRIERVQRQEALVNLVSQSYTARVFRQFLQGSEARLHFLQCSELATKVPVSVLKRPNSLSLLPDLAQLVEEDLASEVGAHA